MLVIILFSFFILLYTSTLGYLVFFQQTFAKKLPRLCLQPSGSHVQGKGILIAGMAPDLSHDNTCSERLNFSETK